MRKIICIILTAVFSLSISCNEKDDCIITKESLYFSQGITNGFTIQLINVTKYDSSGIPVEYKEEVIRTDLINNSSKKIKIIYFFQKNPHCGWSYQLRGKFDTIPIKFEIGKWYVITSTEFKKGIFKNIHYRFFVYKDSSDKFHLFQSSEAVSPI